MIQNKSTDIFSVNEKVGFLKQRLPKSMLKAPGTFLKPRLLIAIGSIVSNAL